MNKKLYAYKQIDYYRIIELEIFQQLADKVSTNCIATATTLQSVSGVRPVENLNRQFIQAV